MLSSNGNPFLRAEYLNPPPATNTMDSKKSPLALLAQTCSQIGADPTPTTATKTASSSTMTTTTTTGHPSGESRKKSASECLAHDNRHEPRGSPSASVVSSPEANNNRVAQQQQQRPASSANDAAQSLPNAATQTLKTASIKKASDVSSNPNRLTPTDRRSKSTSPKNRSNAGASSSGVVPPHPTQAVDHPSASTASTSAAFMNHLLLHPSQQQLVGGSHPSHHHNQQQQQQHHQQQHHHLMMAAAALAHGSSDASSSSSSSSSAAAAMSLANSYKSLMAASAGMAYSSGHPSSMSPYPHSPYSPHHHASVAGAGAGAGASAGYGPPHPSALDFGAYANALNAAAVAKSTSSASSGHPFIATSAATAAMMNGYLAGHPAYSVAALQQAMHQQHYGNAAARMASSSSSSSAFSSSSAAALVQSKPTNSNAESACRDPYCTGCPASSSNNNVAASSSSSAAAAAAGQIHMVCTVGCPLSVQCEHMKVPIAAHHLQMLSAPGASSPGSANGQPPPSSPHHNNSNNSNNVNNRPYICNWIVADNYCGKRFASSDDLLQHLRTHTNLSSAAAAAAAAVAPPPESAATSSATGFAHPSSMMRAAYPTPPLSPLSAARYHPYGKANGSTTTSATSLPAQQQQQPGPFPSAVAGLFHPGMAAAMAAMASGGPYGAGPPPPSSAAAAAAAAAHLFHMNPALAPYYSHLSLFAHQTNNQASTRQMPGLGPAPLGGGGLGGQP